MVGRNEEGEGGREGNESEGRAGDNVTDKSRSRGQKDRETGNTRRQEPETLNVCMHSKELSRLAKVREKRES